MLRDAFLDDIVVHGAKLLTDPGLYFTPEADLSFWLNGWRVHYLIFPPVRIRGRLFEVNWFTRIHLPSSPVADPSLPNRMASPVASLPHQRGVVLLVPEAGTWQGTFFAA